MSFTPTLPGPSFNYGLRKVGNFYQSDFSTEFIPYLAIVTSLKAICHLVTL